MSSNIEKRNTGDKTSHQVRSSCAQTILLRTFHNLVKRDLKDTDTIDMQSHESPQGDLLELTITIFKKTYAADLTDFFCKILYDKSPSSKSHLN